MLLESGSSDVESLEEEVSFPRENFHLYVMITTKRFDYFVLILVSKLKLVDKD